jgi:hypothetical protein
MDAIWQILVLAFTVEAVWQTLKMIWEKGFDWQRVAIIALAVLVCCLYGVDMIAAVGVTSAIPIVGMVLTGIVVSRGANFVNDLFTKVYQLRKKDGGVG